MSRSQRSQSFPLCLGVTNKGGKVNNVGGQELLWTSIDTSSVAVYLKFGLSCLLLLPSAICRELLVSRTPNFMSIRHISYRFIILRNRG